jgi:hypothetical protein
MIEIFEGRLGGGKTYSATMRAEEHFARGGHLYTNIELIPEAWPPFMEEQGYVGFSLDQLHFIKSEEIARFYEVTPIGEKDCPTLVIVDEAHIWLDQRAFNKRELDELFYFLTQSRKQNTDVIFISQNRKNLDARIGRLVQYVWTFRDMRRWRLPVFYVKWPFPHLVQNCWDYDGKTLLLKKWQVWDPRRYKLYNTDAMLSNVSRAGTVQRREVKRVNPAVLFLKKHMRFLILLVPIMIGFGIWKVWPMVENFRHPAVPLAAAAAAKSAPASPGVEIHEEILESEAGEFQIGNGPVQKTPLITDQGEYEVGGPCVYGIVERVVGKTAFIHGWDGRRVVVRAVSATPSSNGQGGRRP